MATGNSSTRWLGVFFCSLGCICSGPVFGAEGEGQAIAGLPIAPDDVPAALFETVLDDEQLPQGQQVEVGAFGQIDLHVKDLDLTKVLQLLSIQSQRNIIASRNVAGTISADLYGVDFYEAMDAILHTNGFGYREKGQFIYVYTTEEIAQLEEESRVLVFEIVRLNYLNAADASAFVSPLLSANGSIALSGDVDEGFQPTISDGGSNQSAHQDTLVIRDYAENVEEILDVIEKLDTRPKQVLVEATILQADLTEKNAFGVDFSIFADLNVTDFTTPLGAVDELITGGFNSGSVGTTSAGNVSAGQSSVKLGFIGSDAAVFVRALDSVTDTTVLAKPSVLVLNRQKVELLVGKRLGYISTTATETSNTQTVEFLDIGTQLTLRPFISDDDFVRMELRPSVSDGSTSLVGGFVIPNTTTQELITNVIVRSGQTVVLGGLFKEDTIIVRTNVPGLGNLPVVGAAFKGQDDTVLRSEIIFLIKPTVIKDEALTQMADSIQDGIEATRLGARRGLLPWSRTKLTSSYVRDAMKYMKEGNNDKALWSLDKALYLDPTMADATRLKDEITGVKSYFYDRSILKKAIDSAIDAELMVQTDESNEAVEDIQDDQVQGFEIDQFTDDLSIDTDEAADATRDADADFTEADVSATDASQIETDWDADERFGTDISAKWQPAAEEDVQAQAGFEFINEASDQADQSTGFTNEFSDQAQPAVQAPWRVELNGELWTPQGVAEADDFFTPADNEFEFAPSTSVEAFDFDKFFTDDSFEAGASVQTQPANIFELIESTLGGDGGADAQSRATVSSVDTDESSE